jgi:nucleoside-diphosphate-sugar epimerase
MDQALVIGGTRFVGRHTVSELLEAGYEVTMFNRGNHPDPFVDDDRVSWVEGDRTKDSALEAAADQVDPSIVIDVVAYYPRDVRAATRIFANVDAYVYVSSGAVYADETVPKREDESALVGCSPSEATDDSMETYGARKAEGDRAVFAAADEGLRAMSVRPCIVYGPYDYTERVDYWLSRIATADRVLVPGDGQHLWHRVYVEDVARALRIVAERGEAGAAYNVGDRRVLTLAEWTERLANAMAQDVEVVTAGARELAAGGLEPSDFVLYRDYPHLMETAKLAALGWDSTPIEVAAAETVREHRESERNGSEHDPGRMAEERVLEILDTV